MGKILYKTGFYLLIKWKLIFTFVFRGTTATLTYHKYVFNFNFFNITNVNFVLKMNQFDIYFRVQTDVTVLNFAPKIKWVINMVNLN